MKVHLVLDTTAITTYAGGSLHVGETITQVIEEGRDARFGVPVLCLMSAYEVLAAKHEGDITMLALLDAHRHSELLPLPTRRWDTVAATAVLLGGIDRAAALAAAEGHDAMLLTAEPKAYEPAFEGGRLPSYIIGC